MKLSLMESGKAFQNLGAATQKARSLKPRLRGKQQIPDDRRDINLMSNVFKLEVVTSNDRSGPSSQVEYPT